MSEPPPDTEANRILLRFRRMASVRRALVIFEAIFALLLVLFLVLEGALPGIVGRLFRGWVAGVVLIAALLGALVLTQIGVATLEWLMGATLKVPRTPRRLVTGILDLIPGMMILRRVFQALVFGVWLFLLCLALLGFIAVTLLFGIPLLFSDGTATVLGRATDTCDQVMSWLYNTARVHMRNLAQSPTYSLEQAEDLILPLLQRQSGLSAPLPAQKP